MFLFTVTSIPTLGQFGIINCKNNVCKYDKLQCVHIFISHSSQSISMVTYDVHIFISHSSQSISMVTYAVHITVIIDILDTVLAL